MIAETIFSTEAQLQVALADRIAHHLTGENVCAVGREVAWGGQVVDIVAVTGLMRRLRAWQDPPSGPQWGTCGQDEWADADSAPLSDMLRTGPVSRSPATQVYPLQSTVPMQGVSARYDIHVAASTQR
jgi:hypothetical protein